MKPISIPVLRSNSYRLVLILILRHDIFNLWRQLMTNTVHFVFDKQKNRLFIMYTRDILKFSIFLEH